MLFNLRYEARKWRDKIMIKIVWALPRRLVYWCAIRVMATATTGEYSSTIVPELTGMEALKRVDHWAA